MGTRVRAHTHTHTRRKLTKRTDVQTNTYVSIYPSVCLPVRLSACLQNPLRHYIAVNGYETLPASTSWQSHHQFKYLNISVYIKAYYIQFTSSDGTFWNTDEPFCVRIAPILQTNRPQSDTYQQQNVTREYFEWFRDGDIFGIFRSYYKKR